MPNVHAVERCTGLPTDGHVGSFHGQVELGCSLRREQSGLSDDEAEPHPLVLCICGEGCLGCHSHLLRLGVKMPTAHRPCNVVPTPDDRRVAQLGYVAAHVIQVKDVGLLALLAVTWMRLAAGIVLEPRHGFGVVAAGIGGALRLLATLCSILPLLGRRHVELYVGHVAEAVEQQHVDLPV